MDLAARHRIVTEAWRAARNSSGDYDDEWVGFFEDYFPVQDWVERETSDLSDLECRRIEVTYRALLATLGVDEQGEYESWWELLGADEVRTPVELFDDPDQTDVELWAWPE